MTKFDPTCQGNLKRHRHLKKIASIAKMYKDIWSDLQPGEAPFQTYEDFKAMMLKVQPAKKPPKEKADPDDIHWGLQSYEEVQAEAQNRWITKTVNRTPFPDIPRCKIVITQYSSQADKDAFMVHLKRYQEQTAGWLKELQAKKQNLVLN